MNIKSIMAIGAVALSATVFGEVSSANIVGYTQSAMEGGKYYMCATHFDATTDNGQGYAIKDLISGEVPYGTQIQVMQADTTYKIYYFIEEAYDEVKDEFAPGWADVEDYVAVDMLAPGAAFWFKAPSACNISIAGQILSDASKAVTVPAGQFSMVANPYPVAVNMNDLSWAGLTYGDQFQIMQPDSTYKIYYYIEEAYDEAKDEFLPGWADVEDYLVTTKVLPVGQGAWIKPAAPVTINWASPL